MNWPRWKNFASNDPGYTVTDRCDPTVSVLPDYSKLNIYLDGLYEVTYSAVDASGNKATDVKRYVNIYTEVSGIDNNGSNNLFHVYPNPSNGIVNLEMNLENAQNASVVVFDASGKEIYTVATLNPATRNLQIDLSDKASGMYFVKVVTDQFSASKAFTIQR